MDHKKLIEKMCCDAADAIATLIARAEMFECPFSIMDYDEIGNSVFLTEEAAEAALEERENNG